ncbi:MAG: hypothetical protein ACE5DT_00935 [Nitrosopumilus sp.]
MADELARIVKRLSEIDEKIDDISKQWLVLKHQYRVTKDSTIRDEIKKKWKKLQKKSDTLKKRRQLIIEKKKDIENKKKWKGWK